MTTRSRSLHRGPGERVLAWVVTGPLGHLWSVLMDLGGFAVRSLATRARQRLGTSRNG